MSAWSALSTADGSWTLVHRGLGEACHSRSGAWRQARERYALPCRLAERARGEGLRAFRLLDVGTGLGLNLAAALQALEGTGTPLLAITLEQDPYVIRAGCLLYESLARGAPVPWEPWHERVRRALDAALARPGEPVALGQGGTLVLVPGDARVTVAGIRAGFDAVFLDPFSPRRDGALWQPDFLAALAARMASGSWLSTYSAAFSVRLGLREAGLRVGRGPRVGSKGEGTLASPDQDPPELPLRLVRRLQRRGKRPSGTP